MPRIALRTLLVPLLATALSPPGLVEARSARPQSQAARAADDRLILTPSGATTLRVEAIYSNKGVTCEAKQKKPLRARYRGRLEILRQDDGRLSLINHVTFDAYLKGLSEVPRSWPIEALRAQVVAARSYALYRLRRGGSNPNYDICSTDQCQVYRGVSVEQGAFGEAWVRAVTSTRGEVLLYRGAVIQAFYFSTSSGRTKRSFPGGSPLPYLRSVDGEDDDAPLARWAVRVSLADLGPILAAGGEWPGGTIASVRLSEGTVRVSGSGRSRSMSKRAFRSALNDEAACLFPDRYPTVGPTGRKLPQTVPSIDFSLSQSGGAAVLAGRGWGHGVGMSQFGARSLAERGRTYDRILAHFYAGLRPSRVGEPGRIRVLIAEDASIARVAMEGTAAVTTGTGSTLAPGDRFEVRAGRTLSVRRGGPSLAPVLSVELPSAAPLELPPAGTAQVAYTLSGPAKVSLVLSRGGTQVVRSPETSQVSGPNTLSVALTDAQGRALPEGSYDLVVEAYDGIDRVRALPVALTVRAPPPPGRRPAPDSDGGGGRWPLLAAAFAAAILALGSFVVATRARRGG